MSLVAIYAKLLLAIKKGRVSLPDDQDSQSLFQAYPESPTRICLTDSGGRSAVVGATRKHDDCFDGLKSEEVLRRRVVLK